MVSLCASAAGWVQMRCRECAAEVAVTARVCSRCEAPILGQPPVVADTVVGDTVVGDTVVGAVSDAAVSDAAGKAVATGVVPAEKSPPERDAAEEVPTWEPAPWGASAEEARLVGWAEWAASTTFSSTGLTSGYDKQEVDAFRSAVRDTFLGVMKPPVRSDDVRPGEWFSTHWRGYNKTQVDVFLEVASIRLAAMESTVKVTVVYESMFGNTRKVAEAISDGVRDAYPDAHVECVAVGRASAELIKSTDLLIVGGPTHLRRMTTDFSRKRHISREKKAEAKGEPPHELESDAEGPGLREWFYRCGHRPKGGAMPPLSTLASGPPGADRRRMLWDCPQVAWTRL